MNKNPKNHRDVVDSKVSNFKMYKVNKHWVFASALMLSMLGAGMMSTNRKLKWFIRLPKQREH